MKFIYLLFFILVSACSSLPDSQNKPTESIRLAREQMQKGLKNSTSENHEQAIRHFQTAYGLYTNVDGIRGKIRASLALSRQYLLLKKPEEAEPWIQNSENLIKLYYPEFQSSLLLLQVEQLFIAGRSDSVIKLTDKKFKATPEIAGQIWAYRLLSKDRLRQDFEDELDELESAVDDMSDMKEDHTLEDPFAYSYCSYLTGWAYYATTNYKKALQYYQQAYQTDQELENNRGLADDVFSIAQTRERQGITDEALAGYFRANEMYRQTGRTSEADDAEFRYFRLLMPQPVAKSKLQNLLQSTGSDLLKFEIKSVLDQPDSLFQQKLNPE